MDDLKEQISVLNHRSDQTMVRMEGMADDVKSVKETMAKDVSTDQVKSKIIACCDHEH
jgi:hypothetical protein